MGRYSTLPTLYDDLRSITITSFKDLGYFKSNQIIDGTITWSRNGNKTGSISFVLNPTEMYIRLYYTYRKTDEVDYTVELVKVPSNLGKGYLWYFICPHTGKICRKLYLIGREFLHREAYKNCRYESQTYSERNRAMIKIMDEICNSDKAYEKMYVKHFKRTYKGKPTKRYLKLLKQLDNGSSYPPDTMSNLLSGIY